MVSTSNRHRLSTVRKPPALRRSPSVDSVTVPNPFLTGVTWLHLLLHHVTVCTVTLYLVYEVARRIPGLNGCGKAQRL